MKDLISFIFPLSDGLTGESSVEVPQSLHKEGKDSYTREEAIRNGLEINVKPDANSAVPIDIQIEQHNRRLIEDRAMLNGVTRLDGAGETPFIQTEESLRESRIAEKNGLTQAITMFEPAQGTRTTASGNQGKDANDNVVPAQIVPFGMQSVRPMPSEPLSPANIYSVSDDFSIIDDGTAPLRTQKIEVAIYRRIIANFKIRSYENQLYCFDPYLRYYRPIGDDEVKQWINSCFGEQILKGGRLDKTYDALCKLLHSESSIIIRSVEPDQDRESPFYWPFWNGIVDIRSKKMLPNDGTYFNRHCLQCDYNPEAQCPAFLKVVDTIAGGDPAVLQLIFEVVAYILSPDHSAKAFFSFFGVPDSGKSLLANTLSRMLGKENISALSAENFGDDFGPQDLIGKHLNVCMDLPDQLLSKTSVAKIKMLTGSDLVRANIKHKTAVRFYNTAKLLFGSNHSLTAESFDRAFYDRLVSIPFTHGIPKASQDPDLEWKLRAEYSGIANLAITYYLALKQRKLRFSKLPGNIAKNSGDHSVLCDGRLAVQDDLQQIFEFTKNPAHTLTSEEAYVSFCTYCDAHQLHPCSRNEFSRWMGSHSEKKKLWKGDHSANGFVGVRLKEHG